MKKSIYKGGEGKVMKYNKKRITNNCYTFFT
jgi:hypothetical protein